ncbi:prepilin-type N-terminal cleavage/methylation domain-containing protein [bacterium]|nr:prepilin-type N-terminal cleavage/methylation domain-containing protein [bacterium]
MKERGFTLLEMLTAIAILSILFSLIWTTFSQTRDSAKAGEIRSDHLRRSTLFASELGAAITGATGKGVFVGKEYSIEFETNYRGFEGIMKLEQTSVGMSRLVLVNSQGKGKPFKQYNGTISLNYLDDDGWLPEWEKSCLPKAISLILTPLTANRMKIYPYRVAYNLPVEVDL